MILRTWWVAPLLVLISCAAGIALLWSYTLHDLARERDEVERRLKIDTTNLAFAFGENILRTVGGIDRSLRVLLQAYRDNRADFSKQLKTIHESLLKDLVLQVAFIEPDGFLVHTSFGPIERIDLSDREHFLVHRDGANDELFISKPILGRVSGKWTIQFTRRLTNPDGSFGGVVMISADPDYFTRLFESIDVGEEGVITLVGMDRAIRAHASGVSATTNVLGILVPNDQPYLDHAQPTTGHFQKTPGVIDGIERIGAWRRLEEYPLVVMVLTSTREKLAPFETIHRGQLINVSAVTAAIALLGLSLIWLLMRQHAAEKKLESSQQLLQTALDSMIDGVALFDKNERMVLWNKGFISASPGLRGVVKPGIAFADMIAHMMAEGRYLGVGKDWVDRRIRHFRALEPIEVHILDPDGHERWALLTHYRARDGGTLLVRADITKRKQAENSLRISEARLQSLVKNAPWRISIKDLDGRYLMVSPAWTAFWGFTTEQVIGKTSDQLFSSDLADQMLRRDKDTIASGEVLNELVLQPSDRGERAHSMTKFPIRDDRGQLVAIGSIGIDITEQRQLEEQLRQSQKMEAVGQLTAGVAHDFNNMLAVILGNLELVQEVIQDQKTGEMIAAALRAGTRGAKLTQQLLAFGRRTSLRPELMNLDALIRDMVPLLGSTLGATVEIKTPSSSGPLPRVRIDKNQMENAFINLAANARDAMPRGGKLTIETAEIELNEAQIEAESMDAEVKPGRYVMVAVRDSGAGMAPEVVVRAFEPFFTTKEVGKGSGLGLSMVYGFVKQSGGYAKIYSESGHGTSVTLYFPVAVETSEAVEILPSGEASARKRGGGECILLVDDDKEVGDTVAAQLASLGYDVLRAANGPEAIAHIKNTGKVDLLLCDVILGGSMSGLEVARELRKIHPGLKVVLISGYPKGAAIDGHGIEIVDRLLQKPVRRDDLARAIREELDHVDA